MPKVLTIGSINQDIVLRTDHLPKPGETVFGESLQYFPGGKGANQAIAAKKIYENSYYYGLVGDDAFGHSLIETMKSHTLHSLIEVHTSQPTGTAIISIDSTGENSITVVAGANGGVVYDDITFLSQMNQGDFLILQNEIPQQTNLQLLKRANSTGIITVYNPAPARQLSQETLHTIDFLIVNESEFEIILKKQATQENIEIETKRLYQEYGCTLIVTLGSQGIITIEQGDIVSLPAITVKVVDTTGAGDCFAGTLTGYLALGQPFRSALQKAIIASGLSVTRHGASSSYATREEIESFTL